MNTQIYSVFLLFLVKYAISGSATDKIALSCSHQAKDIAIILDSSSSISDDQFDFAKEIILKLFAGWKAENVSNRLAFQQFATNAQLRFSLEPLTNINNEKIIQDAYHTQGLTDIGEALTLANRVIFPNMRKDVPRFVLLITDGVNTRGAFSKDPAAEMKMGGVQIIGLGIGDELNITALGSIASENSAFILKDAKQLQLQLTQVLDHLCYLPDPVPKGPCDIVQDLVFLIDSSDSLTDDDFKKSKEFVKEFINDPQIKLGANFTRVAMISFSDYAKIEFDIDVYTDIKDYLSAIDKVTKWGSITALGKSLDLTLTKIWPKHRNQIPFTIVLVTDGVNNVYPTPSIPGDKLKKLGVHIISIGVGMEVDPEQLKNISTSKTYNKISSYAELQANIPYLKMLATCG